MGIQFPNESEEYRAARSKLLEQEIALRRQMEAVAIARRALPAGGAIAQDYEFDASDHRGRTMKLKLSQLFKPGNDTLMLYNYMFPRHTGDRRKPAQHGEIGKLPSLDQPCPSCTGLIDQLDGALPHFEAGGGNFAVVAKAPIDRVQMVARERGWRHVRVLSSANNSFKRDYNAEDADGQQQPLMTVFKRDGDGTIRLFWASELDVAPTDPGQDPRGLGTLDLFWNMFDLTPNGRPDFNEQLEYECCAASHGR